MTSIRKILIGFSLLLNFALILFFLMHSNALVITPTEAFLQHNAYLKKSYQQNREEYQQLDKKITKLQHQANQLLTQKNLDEVTYLTLIEKQKVLQNEKRQLIASALFATAANLKPDQRRQFVNSLQKKP